MAERSGLGEFEQVVLLAVAQLGDAGYGVSLQREIRRRTRRAASLGAVYATLARLEEKGYVTSRVGGATAVRGGRARRLFALKPAGARALATARRTQERMWQGLEWDPRLDDA